MARPLSAGSASASASATGTAREFGWTIDSLWMSSISNACPAAPLNRTALVSDVRVPLPHSEAISLPPSACTTSRTIRVQGNVVPRRQTPSPSRKLSLMRSTTSEGMARSGVSAAKRASARVASARSGGCELGTDFPRRAASPPSPRSCGGEGAQASCKPASLRLDVGGADDLAPFLRLFSDEPGEIRRRAGKCGGAPLGQASLHGGIREARIDRLVDLVDDLRRRALRRRDAGPE